VSHAAFWCIRATKCRGTIFHAQVGPVQIPQKRAGICDAKFVFFHLVGYAGHVVHFGVSGPRNVDALLFMLAWDRYGFHEKHARSRYAELVFSHLMGSVGHVVHSGASRA
jgi:hypothetical protein